MNTTIPANERVTGKVIGQKKKNAMAPPQIKS
jgi:hypothetical protein